MKAIVITPGKEGVRLEDKPEPSISGEDEVKLRIIRVGICGTDREEVRGGRALAPDGNADLIIGHEMLGQVIEAGAAITGVKTGDIAVLTVRRGCGHCAPCNINRPDMCQTGKYKERGIWGLDGYQAQFVVENEKYVVPVPRELEPIAVLAEPMSVAEKAIDEVVRLQISRLAESPAVPEWLNGRRCLVAGLGPIGLLAAVALKLRRAEVFGLDIVDQDTVRPQWLEFIGGHYIDGRKLPPEDITKKLGPMDLIFEAAGIAGLAFNLLDALAINGGYVLTGIPGDNHPLQISGAELLRNLVLDNQLMVGSVNASRDHFQMAVSDLRIAQLLWGDHVSKLITHRYRFDNFGNAFEHQSDDEIKTVIDW